ncbi:mating type [Fusarium heterosporum]|uniref:Mating type n=1 Tax=Fusarium heterosporum TaxID=42747 RepID=A0A8H5WXR2_FUSHE|nr:mating type [Fusarium heterosporum]
MSSLILMPPGGGPPMLFTTPWTSKHVNHIFQCLSNKSKESKCKFVVVPASIYESMDIGAKTALANLFLVEFGEPVLFARDNKDECYYLGVPRELIKNGGMLAVLPGAPEAVYMQRPVQALKPVKIPRPANAYILYRKERHQVIKQRHPAITNNQISQVLGRCWNMETREVRALYKQKADILKEEHRRLHPDYQYRPRRPSERRRRAQSDNGDALLTAPVVPAAMQATAADFSQLIAPILAAAHLNST